MPSLNIQIGPNWPCNETGTPQTESCVPAAITDEFPTVGLGESRLDARVNGNLMDLVEGGVFTWDCDGIRCDPDPI